VQGREVVLEKTKRGDPGDAEAGDERAGDPVVLSAAPRNFLQGRVRASAIGASSDRMMVVRVVG